MYIMQKWCNEFMDPNICTVWVLMYKRCVYVIFFFFCECIRITCFLNVCGVNDERYFWFYQFFLSYFNSEFSFYY